GGDRWESRLAYETDRPLPNGWDVGLDRFVASLGGPIKGARFFAAVDARARIDDDPVSAPASTDPLDPRFSEPWVLPHNSGEQYDALAKLTVPIGDEETVRLLGVRSIDQRLLFDPELKYALGAGDGQRVDGQLGLFNLQHRSRPDALNQLEMDFRLGYFSKEAVRAPLAGVPDDKFGAFTLSSFTFLGEDMARAQDTVSAQRAIAGFAAPDFTVNTPWGAPAFFRDASSRGELAWNRFSDLRGRLDVLIGIGPNHDLRLGGEYSHQTVETFTRLEAFHSVADGAPAPRVSSFAPVSEAAYAEFQHRDQDLTIQLGLRLDGFDARAPGDSLPRHLALSPRIAVTSILPGFTFTASVGRFVQPPDFQYLVDAAFDDSLRTGRFRQGNPNLGFESSTQFEFAVRARPWTGVGTRVSIFQKRLDGLVASIPVGFNPDSAIFGNGDYGEVKGLEVTFEHEYDGNVGARLTYVLQDARATATDAFNLFRRLHIAPSGDTIVPAIVTFPLDYDRRHSLVGVFRARVPRGAGAILGGFEASVVGRWTSGLPYSRTNLTGDSLIGLPNSYRLPAEQTLDLLIRRVVRVGGLDLGLYIDGRNITNTRLIQAVRRDTGSPDPGPGVILAMAEQAYAAHPEAIPYESPRYRSFADLNGDGIIAGRSELLPLYQRAAQDFLQPIFAYGPPRLIRIGTEIAF
ncbi:MAG TPA: TonB-dependent receptor, partial [Gemmatimonadales bacterium]